MWLYVSSKSIAKFYRKTSNIQPVFTCGIGNKTALPSHNAYAVRLNIYWIHTIHKHCVYLAMECFLPLCKSHHKHPKSNLKFAIILRHPHTYIHKCQSIASLHSFASFVAVAASFLFHMCAGTCVCAISIVSALCRFGYNLIQSCTHLHHAIFIIGMHGNHIFLKSQIVMYAECAKMYAHSQLCEDFERLSI